MTSEVLFACALIVARALSWPFPSARNQFLLALAAPLVCAAGLYLLARFASRLPWLYEIAKFSLVGLLNTAIDFGVLDLLLFVTGYVRGVGYSLVKTTSFLVAVGNSYVWNKFWTFKAREHPLTSSEFARFLAVSVIALLANVAVASWFVNRTPPLLRFTPIEWANCAAVLGTVVAAVCNFLGYKFHVFRFGRRGKGKTSPNS